MLPVVQPWANFFSEPILFVKLRKCLFSGFYQGFSDVYDGVSPGTTTMLTPNE